MLGDPACRYLGHQFLHGFAIGLRRQRRYLALHAARLGPGDLGVAFLVPLDVARQRVPDHRQLGAGAAVIVPAQQDDLRMHGDAGGADAAAAVFLDIGGIAAERILVAPGWRADEPLAVRPRMCSTARPVRRRFCPLMLKYE